MRHRGADVATTRRTTDGRDVDFVADQPGVYEVTLDVTGGSDACPTWVGDKNVRDPGAMAGSLRLRFTPPASAGAPTQERLVVVPGGADFAAGVLAIDPGESWAIVVRDGGGAAVPAYVRLTSRATPDATIEVITSAGGGERADLATGRYDALVIPLVDDLAPAVRTNWEPALGALQVAAGTTVAGTVHDAGGGPVVGARVSIAGASDLAPSTVATTAADGTFAINWQARADATLVVAPPIATGLARLTAPLAGLDLTTPLDVRYQAGHPVVDLGGVPVRAGGALAASGHVLFALDLGVVATVTDGVTATMAEGHHRDRVAVDAAGRLAPYRATAGSGRAFVIGAPGPGAVALLDLAQPLSAIDAPASATLVGVTVDAAAAPVAGARLTATVDGDLAHLDAPTATAVAGADGRFTMALAPGATYQLAIVDPRARVAARRLAVSAIDGDLGLVTLPPAVRVRGTVRLVGQSVGLPDVGVTALCGGCAGLDRTRPLGEAVSDVAGDFAVVVPDPSAPP
ncbi:MAG: carboxypeptidase regulatory-like domain-containing protein [Myxococcales bacterium]|nr:carboxypeptidase regulatory-like domain-containing protein [Myxococcales bacterium]